MAAVSWILASVLLSPPAHGGGHGPAPAPKAQEQKGHAAKGHGEAPASTGDVFADLMAGNKRFASGKSSRPHQDKAWLKEQAKGQAPKVVVVGCADSRVPPEMVFDQGVGDVFVVRAAGSLADVFALGSIEYAVEHLGVKHLLVLGHEKCGAVKAAVDSAEPASQSDGHGHEDEDEPGAASISALVAEILPSVEEASGRDGNLLNQAIAVNTRRSMEKILEKSPMLKHRVLTGGLSIACGVYSLDTGLVRWTEKPSVSGGFVRVHP